MEPQQFWAPEGDLYCQREPEGVTFYRYRPNGANYDWIRRLARPKRVSENWPEFFRDIEARDLCGWHTLQAIKALWEQYADKLF